MCGRHTQLKETTLTELLRLHSETTFLKPRTIKLYKTIIRHFDRFVRTQRGGDVGRVIHLADANLVAYVSWRISNGIAKYTAEREAAKLFALWRVAAKPPRCWIAPPSVKLPRSKVAPAKAFLKQQLRTLFRDAHQTQRVVGGLPGSIYWPACLGCIWDTSERINAVHNLHRSDIEIVRVWRFTWKGYVTFRNRKGDGDDAVRVVRRSTAKALATLLELSDAECPFAIVKIGTIYKAYNKILADAGLPTDRWSKFHRLRKSHASYLKRAGGDAAESLGHSSEAVTRRHYYDPRITGQKPAAAYLFNPLGLGSRIVNLLRSILSTALLALHDLLSFSL